MTVTYMTEGYPKSWDKTLRTYEITCSQGKKILWKDVTARDCLTRYDLFNAENNHQCQLREIVGKELQLQKITDK